MKHLLHRYFSFFKDLFFESITAVTSTKGHFLDVSLIDRKILTGLRSAFAIDKTQTLLCQHGAGKKEPTAITTLATVSFPEKELLMHVIFPEMNQVKSSGLSNDLHQEAGFPHKMRVEIEPTAEISGQNTYIYAMHHLSPR